MSEPAVVLFTRDLRIHDNPVLAAAAEAGPVVPLFVQDPHFDGVSTHRRRFLDECLADLDSSLSRLGSRLTVRSGDVAAEVMRVVHECGATQVHVAADHSAYARAREQRLHIVLGSARVGLTLHDDVHHAVEPGRVTPADRDHFAVFTPYARRWDAAERRAIAPAPTRLRTPPLASLGVARPAGHALLRGGESAARERARAWFDAGVDDYAERRDVLADDGTSRLSPYLHFGCISARELESRAGTSAGARAFVRQLTWRDFHHQVLAARPDAAHADYRPGRRTWSEDPGLLEAWKAGETGVAVVDAGMRQLAAQGWMHNRARMITASFLTKSHAVDWRHGAAHFAAHLLDADVANNALNWQWIAGTGTDTRPNRVLNPQRQARRFDQDGRYRDRWLSPG